MTGAGMLLELHLNDSQVAADYHRSFGLRDRFCRGGDRRARSRTRDKLISSIESAKRGFRAVTESGNSFPDAWAEQNDPDAAAD